MTALSVRSYSTGHDVSPSVLVRHRRDRSRPLAQLDWRPPRFPHLLEHYMLTPANDNTFGGSYDVQRGLKAARVSVLLLRPRARRGALVVDCDIPDSRYWSFHLYNLAWWEALRVRPANHRLNHANGSATTASGVVLAHEDGSAQLARHRRRQALLTLRWFWRTATRPRHRPTIGKARRRAGLLPDRPSAAGGRVARALAWRSARHFGVNGSMPCWVTPSDALQQHSLCISQCGQRRTGGSGWRPRWTPPRHSPGWSVARNLVDEHCLQLDGLRVAAPGIAGECRRFDAKEFHNVGNV